MRRTLAALALPAVLLAGCGTTDSPDQTQQQETTEEEDTEGQEAAAPDGDLADQISSLEVAPEEQADSYDREAFGDYDRDQALADNQSEYSDCDGYYSRYDDTCHASDSDVDVDETVARAEAWRSGAHAWPESELDAFGGDEANLALMTSSVNRHDKSDADPTEWTPQASECAYAETWVAVKLDYDLTADSAEVSALEDMAASC